MRCFVLACLFLAPVCASADLRVLKSSFLTTTLATNSKITVTFPVGNQFEPKVVFFFGENLTDTAAAVYDSKDSNHCFGVGISSSKRHAVAGASEDNVSTTNDACAIRDDSCYVTINLSTGSYDGRLDLDSMNSDGFTLTVDDQFSASTVVHYWALGGSDITDVDRTLFSEPASTGTQSVTPWSFQPDILIFMSIATGQNPPTVNTSSSRLAFGFADGTNDYLWLGGSDGNIATSDTKGYLREGDSLGNIDSAFAGINSRGNVSSMLSTGFQVNWSEVTGSAIRDYMAVGIKGAQWVLGDLLTQLDTVTQSVETGFGFAPKGALFVSGWQPESTLDTLENNNRCTMGAYSWHASTLTQGCTMTYAANNAATSSVTLAIDYANIYNRGFGSGVFGAMEVESSDSDGFTCKMTNNDVSPQRFVAYFAVGPNEVETPRPGTMQLFDVGR